MQKMVPADCGRGMVLATGGIGSVFEAGTFDELWKTAKAVPVGPNGIKGVRCVSEEITAVPSREWEAMTRRGSGRAAIVAVGFVG